MIRNDDDLFKHLDNIKYILTDVTNYLMSEKNIVYIDLAKIAVGMMQDERNIRCKAIMSKR